jgi:hypothetical protein
VVFVNVIHNSRICNLLLNFVLGLLVLGVWYGVLWHRGKPPLGVVLVICKGSQDFGYE